MESQIYREKRIIQENFSGEKIYCGVDVHKNSWKVSTYIGTNFHKTHSQESDPVVLKSYLENNFPNAEYHACYEAGFTGFSISRTLQAFGINCCVVNPADIPTTNKDKFSKTDVRDSRKIAEAFAKGLLTPIWEPDMELEGLRKLIRLRSNILKTYESRRQHIKSLLFTIGLKLPFHFDKPHISNNYLKWLQEIDVKQMTIRITMDELVDQIRDLRKRLLHLNKEIKKIAESEKYKQMNDLLISVPGIGLITATTFIAEIGDINRFESFRKFNSYVGICPSEFSSGEKERKSRITPRANKILRSLVIEAAWRVKNSDPAMAKSYHELTTKKNKKNKDAIVIIARKLLSRVYSVWKNQTLYVCGIKMIQ